MTKRPVIGITAGEVINLRWPNSPKVYGQGFTYVDSIIRAGGIPFILPITEDQEVIRLASEHIDGLLMSGGNDITPSMYGQEPYAETIETSTLRDKADKMYYEEITKINKPILAICRGMQIINVIHGGTLHQDILTDVPGAMNHQSSNTANELAHKAHTIEIDTGSKLCEILGTDKVWTNTHHHQAINKLGKKLRVTAKAEDGVVEAMETTDDRFLIGIQAHPESLGESIPAWDKLFRKFIAETKTPSNRRSSAVISA